MERTCPPPSNSNPSAGGAAKFLANLPNRGFLSSTTIPSANPGGMRVYICDHDTKPPEDQLIKTNQMNILIRSLVLNKQKGEASSKAKGIVINEGSRKRMAEKSLDGRASSKKAATSSTPNSSRHEGSKSRGSDKDFQSMKVEELRSLLREQGLPPKGRKDELIARLRSVDV